MGLIRRMLTAPDRNPEDEHWWQSGPGGRTITGTRVTPELALSIGTVFACVRVIAEDESALPLKLYRRRAIHGREGKELARDHYLYDLFHDQPNPRQDSMEWREMSDMHVTLRGNGYSRIHYHGSGRVERLEPLHPDDVSIEVLDSGDVRYRVKKRRGGTDTLLADEMFHLRGLSSDGYAGLSVVGYARESFALSSAMQEHGARFYRQGTRFSGHYLHPKELGKDAYNRLQSELDVNLAGVANHWKAPLLEDGLTFKENSMSAQDAQWVETIGAQGKEICRWFRMQPHKVGILDDATYSNIEHQAIEHVTDTILPWNVRWEQALNRTFGLSDEGLFVEHVIDGLLRGDIKSRYEAYAMGRQWGWFSQNDVREMENLNPIEGGDTYLQPLNMVDSSGAAALDAVKALKERGEAAGALVRAGYLQDDVRAAVGLPGMADWGRPPVTIQGEGGQSASVSVNGASAQARLIVIESALRLVRKEVAAVTRNAERFAGDNAAWRAWVGEFYSEHWKAIMGSLHIPAPVAQGYCQRQSAELLEHGLKAVESWDHVRPQELASLALGERIDEPVPVSA